MDDSAASLRQHLIQKEAEKGQEKYSLWSKGLDEYPPGEHLRLKEGYVSDLELQPMRWLQAALAQLESARVTTRVQVQYGAGAAMTSYLPYPVFAFGVELFLKGMLLCRYSACRRLAQNSYVNKATRERYDKILRSKGHNLKVLMIANRRLKAYRTDDTCVRFLNRVDAVIRAFYYPLARSDESSGWATARYPKRFYDDQTRRGAADGLQSYPRQELVVTLFKEMEAYLDRKWELTSGLVKHLKGQS
jgi:hypothetical protein